MLANKECQAALEVLQESPLYDCRCKRAMKRELQCLQIYWSIHLGLTEGEQFYETSPYEPTCLGSCHSQSAIEWFSRLFPEKKRLETRFLRCYNDVGPSPTKDLWGIIAMSDPVRQWTAKG
ncbi:UNVERIFIED_CONTAM: hypothetical protein FKN15_036693 [Acipenser sinensis]